MSAKYTGTMLTFDMNLAMESVSKLQTVISRACHISEDKQVLLISGGESLDPHARVGRYSAGTDTNPIFLFSKTTIEAATPPSPSVHHGSDIDLQGQVEGSLLMPPAYETVVSRTQLAVQFHEVDEDELKACVNLVHDQHLQQQGWAAVVANLEDITVALIRRSNIFQSEYEKYLAKRQDYLDILAHIGDSLHLQTKIPLLSCLPISQGMSEVAALSTSRSPGSEEVSVDVTSVSTLFQWINSQDPHHTLQDMVDRCIKAAEQFDEAIPGTLKQGVSVAIEDVNNTSMKEVKGLEDRLYGLDQIMSGARKLVEEQSDMAKGFRQNQSRASNLKDKSILPDLCASHKKQLISMLNNHKKLRDIKKKCRMAKEELAVNLHTRLRWVMFVEKKICDIDGKLTLYHESLRRLHKQLDIMKQINEAPRVYAQLVVEVVRRRMYSVQFLEWANSLAEEAKQLHTEEIKRRHAFQQELGKHFLQTLFQGFEDLPPPFATEAPVVFDKYLPEITSQDVEMLRQAVPELQDVFRVPNDIPVSQRMSFQTVGTSVSFHDKLGMTSPTNSEIDVLQGSGEQLFVHIDGSKMSLGEQVAVCENSQIIIDPQTIPIVEKPEFPVPQSLSETLTAEMSSQVKAINVGSPLGKVDIVVPSPKRERDTLMLEKSPNMDGDADVQKSSESEGKSSEKSVRKATIRKKSLGKSGLASDTSPEMETSQEFATADFYFDESMPSSMIDSPPNKSAVSEKGALSSSSDKTEIIVSLEKELGSKQEIVVDLENRIKTLHYLVVKDLDPLKESLCNLKSLVSSDKKTLKEHLTSTQNQIVQVVNKFVTHLEYSHGDFAQNLSKEFTLEKEKLVQSLEAEQLLVHDLKENCEKIRLELEAQKVVTNALEVQSESNLRDLKAQHSSQLDEIKQKHLLELELEIDKLREEFGEDLNRQETMIQTLNDQIEKSESKLEECTHEKEVAIETLNTKFQREKEEISSILAESYKKEKDAKVVEIKASLEKEHKERLTHSEADMRKKIEKEMEEFKKSISNEKDAEIKRVAEKMKKDHEENISELSEKFQEDKNKALADLRESLEKSNSDIMAEMEKQYLDEKEKSKKILENQEQQTEMLLENHEQQTEMLLENQEQQTEMVLENQEQQTEMLLENREQQTEYSTEEKQTEMLLKNQEQQTSLKLKNQEQQTEKSLENQNQSASLELEEAQYKEKLEKALQEEREKHILEISRLEEQFQKEREDSLTNFKTSITAEKQILFNEAVEKVRGEKDKIIETLKAELQNQKLSFDNISGGKPEEGSWSEKLAEKELEFNLMRHKLEDELAMSQHQISQYQQQLMGPSDMSVSRPVSASASASVIIEGSSSSESFCQLPLPELEKMMRSKDIEINRLKGKVMEMSMSMSITSKASSQDKVSIMGFKTGDLVLVCRDEPHDQYVVFTVKTTLHFLHSDCLELLGLKTAAGEPRRSWVLAEITEKEYCQARKPQNRFKVPVGTKFYRVKAIPWSRDVSSSSEVIQASSQSDINLPTS